jgi:mono/diheme cytochrome c family protein
VAAGGATAKGAQIYAQNCASCHQAGGAGVPGGFPPLAGNPYVTGPPTPVIHTLLYGLSGAQVEGKSYAAQMPPWKGTLSNGDIAAVITYIRSAWGNKGSPVTAADVAKVTK